MITFQGDGDFAAIGTAESVHCFNRGENVTVIYINNGIYGMTGGQMSPTTLPHQKSSTSPLGRDPRDMGNPIRMCEMLATLEGTAYAERVAMVDPKQILRTKKAIKKALSLQVDNNRTREAGTGLVEILTGCPTNWKMTPTQSNQFVANEMTRYFPLGVFRDPAESPT